MKEVERPDHRLNMATPIRWKQRARVAPLSSVNQTERPLRALALSLSQAARSALAEPYLLTVEHHPIHLRRLPKVFDGFRIVQLSDIHHSPFTSREQIERAVGVANSLQPDIVALTGDYISKEREYAAPCARNFPSSSAQGVYAVL